uniref:Uncharacterized protein n=1 Tax=Timema douglasi TaxID=61478 RepID=A0A7R8Z596_TIMDO|nr:unnamed protein product [Timema douglasi]
MLWSANLPGTTLSPELYRDLLSAAATLTGSGGRRHAASGSPATKHRDPTKRRGLQLLHCPCTGYNPHGKPPRPKTQWYVKSWREEWLKASVATKGRGVSLRRVVTTLMSLGVIPDEGQKMYHSDIGSFLWRQ